MIEIIPNISPSKKIILGTVQFGLNYGINNKVGKPNFENVSSILDNAFQNDITMLDTAEAYGNAHEVIGNYHKQSKNSFQVITKFSTNRKDLPVNIDERVERNCDDLGVKSLYAYMFHSYPDFIKYYSKHALGLEKLKHNGSIKKIGVSVYTNDELLEVLKYPQVELIQFPFNLLDNYFQRKEALEMAATKGVEVHTRSVFLQGIFFMNPNLIPEKIKPLQTYLETLHSIASAHKISISDLAFNYALQQNSINKVLIGVDNNLQLEQNIESAKQTISAQLIELIDKIRVEQIELLSPANWN
jgi:aryl-alcohol dehydrogenase-like predicted oxidoreductase